MSLQDDPELGSPSRLRVNLQDPCTPAMFEVPPLDSSHCSGTAALRMAVPALPSSSGLGEEEMRGLGKGRGRGSGRKGL